MVEVIAQGPGNAWGVCGFVGVLNALRQTGKLKEFGTELSTASVNQRLGPEIISYLKVTAVERPSIAEAILAFTRSFGTPYDKYRSIDAICADIKQAVLTGKGTIGVAMPVEAVEDYIRWVGHKPTRRLDSSTFTGASLLQYKGCIVGCGRGAKAAPWFGLRHWVYVDAAGHLLNWGTSIDLTTQPLPKAVTDKGYAFIPYAVQVD